MSAKTVNSQVKKALQLIVKERWEVEIAIEASYTSVSKEIDYTTFTNLVLNKLEKE